MEIGTNPKICFLVNGLVEFATKYTYKKYTDTDSVIGANLLVSCFMKVIAEEFKEQTYTL